MRYLLIFTFIFSVASAQNEANIWYFGDQAGLDFNTGSPVPIFDSSMTTAEGCSTISDFNGNLLFYTDGVTVWDKNHIPMPNGMGLLGSFSSSQSSVVVPKPGNPNIYYVFTVDDFAGPDGLRYSEIDMTLNNGNGDITSNKNILLLNPVTEKISAVLHQNGQDFWLVTKEWDSANFHSFLIDSNGVSPSVVSSAGTVHTGDLLVSIGYLKISPNGKRLATAKFGNERLLELFDFDNSTGIVSNPINIDGVFNLPLAIEAGVYGIEFSPNSQLLYVTEVNNSNDQSVLHQFDISSNNTADIINSNIQIAESGAVIGALQLGPDGKIYLAKAGQTFLGVINEPDEYGLDMDYISDGTSLGSRASLFGLPQFIQSFFNVAITTEGNCFGEEVQFEAELPDVYDSLLWDFGDNTTSTLESPTHVYGAPGDYTVSITITSGENTVTETTVITISPLPEVNPIVSIEQCDDDQDGFSVFNLNEANAEISANFQNENIAFFESLDSAQSNLDPIPNPTAYINQTVSSDTVWARVESLFGCVSTSQINLLVTTTQIPDTFLREFIACDDGEDFTDGVASFDFSSADTDIQNLFPAGQQITIAYYRNLEDALSEINPITDVLNYQNTDYPVQQDIYVRVDSLLDNDCLGLGPYISLIVEETPIANSLNDIFFCDDLSNDGEKLLTLSEYDPLVLGEQSDSIFEVLYFNDDNDAINNINALSEEYIVSGEEQLFVRIQNTDFTDCFDITSLFISIEYTPIANPVDNIFLCDQDFDQLEFFDLSVAEISILDGQSDVENLLTYHLSLEDADNNDNPIDELFQNTSNPQTIYARLENLNSPSCYTTTSFDIEVLENPIAEIPDEFILCEGIPLLISLEDTFDEYLWSTGETTQEIIVTEPGTYDISVTRISNGISCQDTKSFEVIESNPATILDVEIEDWRRDQNSITIIVEGLGDYEYSIDGISYQDSNEFFNLNESEYTIRIRDKNGCGEVLRLIYFLDYPDFFTPNGDGINDYWQIVNAKQEIFSKILIFDRYGKLLADLFPADKGWDGFYNGKRMPSNDYWFKVEREDGRVFSGNFTLKR